MKTGISYILIGLLLALCAFLYFKNGKAQRVIIRYTDTLYVTHTVVDTLPVIKYRYITRTETDTLYTTDSVRVPVVVPISQTLFAHTLRTDSDTISYKAYVSGYHTSIDSIRFHLRYQRTVNHIIIKQPRRHFYFSHGIQAGLGFGLFSRKPDLYVGYGVTFNF